MFTLRVRDVFRHSSNSVTIKFAYGLNSYPGQFIMLNLFGYEEIPLSLSSPDSVTVKAVGETTRALLDVKPGDTLGVRGPFGNPFSLSKNALIIAGGIGIAPMVFLYNSLKKFGADVKVVYGAKTKEELVFSDMFENAVFFTEDGSYGNEGTAVNGVIDEELSLYEKIYVCGPESMMHELIKIFEKEKVIDRAEFSLEKYMRCGIGVCGSCVLENGLRVCADGPVFKGNELI